MQLHDPSSSSFPLLEYALKGEGVVVNSRPKWLPISPVLLCKIDRARSTGAYSPDHFMLWAAFCLGFFGFLRAGEFTCTSQLAFSADVSVNSHSSPTHMQVLLKRSKTDPFGAGFMFHLGSARGYVGLSGTAASWHRVSVHLLRWLNPIMTSPSST